MVASLTFDSPLLASILEAVKQRGKAIRYRSSLQCAREVEHGLERLNVDLQSVDCLQLRLSIWSDAAFCLSVNKPGPRSRGGWQIDEQIEGSLASATPLEILERLEQSMIRPTEVASIWPTQHT